MVRNSTHELDHRSHDGLEVTLLWEAEANRVSVVVFDARSGDDFDIEVGSAEALDAFHHPYAYAASRGFRFTAATRALVNA